MLGQHERALGAESLDTLATRSNLAAAYLAAGRTNDAVELNQAIVHSYERIVGLEDPDTLTSLSNLASSYQAIGRVDDAVGVNEKVLEAASPMKSDLSLKKLQVSLNRFVGIISTKNMPCSAAN